MGTGSLLSGAMRCRSGGVESGTTLGEMAGDVKTGARAILASDLGDGSTRRVGAVVTGTGETVGVMAVVKIREKLVREWSVSSPTVEKGATGSGLDNASAMVLVER